MYRIKMVFVLAAAVFLVSQNAMANDDICGGTKLSKRDPIPFRPFPLENPKTGEKYLPNEEIEVSPGKTMVASKFFDELNDLENSLNAWGYTLRDSGDYTLGELVECVELLEKQKKLIDEDVADNTSFWELDEHLSQLKDRWESYTEKLPSWDTLMQKADNEEVKVYLPSPPAFRAPTPTMKRLEMKDVVKERSWSYEIGDKSKFYASALASLKLEAGKTHANATAIGQVRAALFNQWEGDIIKATANASVNNNSAGSLSFRLSAVGRTIYSKQWQEKSLKKGDELKYTVDKGVDYRFSIGPVPMRARVGFNGSIGLKYGFQVIPIEIGAYAVPFVSAKGYLQVGIDIGIAGAGVGGDLTLIADYFTITGTAGVSFGDEWKLVLELTGHNVLEALSGELYAYAYVDYFIDRWEGRFTLFDWTGFKHEGEVFRYRTEWSPSGATAEGDVTMEDIKEINEINAELRLAEFEHESEMRLHEMISAMSEDLHSDATHALTQENARLQALDKGLRQAISAYWDEVRDWGVVN